MPSKKDKKSTKSASQFRAVSSEAIGVAQAKEAGSDHTWHYGRVTRIGHFEMAGGREVVIAWEEGGFTSARTRRPPRVTCRTARW